MVEVAREQGDARAPEEITMADLDRLSAKITRRLALAALRLAVLSIGARELSPRIFTRVCFGLLARWSGCSVGDEATHAINVAIDEAVAALREAGEVSE